MTEPSEPSEPTEWQRIATFLSALPGSRVEVGPGDDAAVVDGRVYTVDAAVEDVHFKRGWLSLEELGARSLLVAASDVIAMRATPSTALVSLELPRAMSLDELSQLGAGFSVAAQELGLDIIGGNMTSGSKLSIHTTVSGELTDSAVLRSGAQEGDTIFVSSDIGGARIGLLALLSGMNQEALSPFIERWKNPRVSLATLPLLANAHAAIDLSDGFAQDLGHVCQASGLDAHVDIAALPKLDGFGEACALLDIDEDECALASGEDYAVLFTSALTSIEGATAVGSMQKVQGERPLVRSGSGEVIDVSGFDHFSSI